MKPTRIFIIAIIVLSFTISSVFSQVPSPAAWWQAQNNAQDSAGTNNGVIESSLSYVTGESGEAFSFAGGTVNIPDAADLDPMTNITVQIWVKGSAPSSVEYILTKEGGAAGASYAFYTGANNGLAFWVNVPGDTGYFGLIISPLADPAVVWDGNWHQATGTYDGTAVHLYVDGVEIGTGTPYIGGAPGGPTISYANAGQLLFGNFSPGGPYAWPGTLDDIKVFDRTMAASEVLDTFTNSASTFATNGLASWYRADGNALDSWGANNGTVNASTISFFQGKLGQAFLSAGGAIVVPDAPALEPQNITVQAWVKSTAPGTYKYVLSKCRVPTWGSYALYTSGNGGMAFYASIGSSGSGTLTLSPLADPGQIWDGAWHQVTGSYDGAALHLYVDGIEVGSGTQAPGGIDYASTNTLHDGAFVIANDPTLGFPISGGIDEVKIWDQALTAQQVLESFTSYGGLISWWQAETNANDSVGINNGTIDGNVSYTQGRLSGEAFDFVDGAVVVSNSVTLEPSNVTVEATVSGAAPGANKYLVSKSFSSTSASYAFCTGAGGGLSFYVTLSGGVVASPAIASSAIWDGNYHFVAGTYDGQVVRIYLDGNQIGSGTAATGAIQYGVSFSSGELLLGDFADTLTSSNFVGLMDNIKIFSGALSLSNAQADAFQPAFITSQPQSISVAPGSTASFSVNALPVGAGYQWTFNGTNLPGATQPILTLTNIQPSQAGAYQLIVSASEPFVPDSLLGGQAFQLTSSVIDVPQDSSLEPQNEVTVQAWVRKAGSPSSFTYMINKSFSGGVGSYALYTPGSGGAAFYIWLTGNSLVVSPDAGSGIWDGNWHQLTGVYDGELVNLYVDGVEVGGGSDTFGGGTIDYTNGRTANGDFIIGSYAPEGTGTFGGDEDEVKVFNIGLSGTDVMSTYTDLTGEASTNGLVSWWKAEGNAFDSFGHNNGRILPPPGTISSDVATLTVQAASAVLKNIQITGGNFQASISGPTGQTYVVQRTANLNGGAWTPILTNTVPFTFTDPLNGNANRFYRAISQP